MRFVQKLKRVRGQDLLHIFLFLIALPASLIYRRMRPNLWLLCEYKNEARDNGSCLFKYIRENKPSVDAVYAIDKKSPDYMKVKSIGPVVSYGTLAHWVLYLAAAVNISSQKGGKPNAAVCYFLEVYGLVRNRRVFLQHGILMNDLPYLHYENTRMTLFTCSAEPEYRFVLDNFGYPPGQVVLTGLCRHDTLTAMKEPGKTILVMPTWRKWLAHPETIKEAFEDTPDFSSSNYLRSWQKLLDDKALHSLLEQTDYHLIFCPHRNMEPFLRHFRANHAKITIKRWSGQDIQALLTAADVLVTDYSSVSLDFAYMDKPLVYYQFDREHFHQQHLPSGYFNYENNGFGPVCHQPGDVSEQLAAFVLNQVPKMNEVYDRRRNQFFTFRDQNNCQRVFEAIEQIM